MPESVYVRGEGPLDAQLMIVGEAPGYYENLEGRPFVGPSGNLVNQFLREAGIDRSQCYVTNVVKYRPPDNNLGRLKELGITIESGISELYREIQTVNPNCILALGNTALKYLTGRSGKGNKITENRGSILRVIPAAGTDSKVVPAFHPANLLHGEGAGDQGDEAYGSATRICIEFDFNRAVEESRTRSYNIPQRHHGICRNSLDTHRYLERNRDKKRVAVDIESKFGIPIILGLAFSTDESFSIPLLDFSSPYHEGRLCSTSRDVAESLISVARVLANPNLEVIGQNFKFDQDKLELMWVWINGLIIDIMLLHKTLYPEFPAGLDFMTSFHTREPFYKIEGREFVFGKDKLEDYCIYNGKDCCVTLEIANTILPDLEDFGLKDFFFGFGKGDWRYPFGVQKLHHLYRHMERVGFLFDSQKNKELKKKYGTRKRELQSELDKLVGNHVNVNSPKQVAFLLYEHLKLPRRAGTGEDVLVALMNSPQVKNETHKEAIAKILEIRRVTKTIGTYLNAAPDFDGRMRTSYNIVGTETGRTSTGIVDQPVRPYKMGLAFQTMTKHGEIGPDLRKQFPADPGYVYIQADAKQAEARVVFLLAELYDRLKQMDDPSYDIHSITASWFYSGETPQEIRKQKEKRFTGKTIRHAGHLGMGKRRAMFTFNNDAQKFGIDAKISEWKAGQLLDAFHENDPKISGGLWKTTKGKYVEADNGFWREVFDEMDRTKILVSPFGRRREFFGEVTDHWYKEGLSFIPQATIADNTKRAMLGIKEEIQDVRYVLEWHDGFLALVPEKEVDLYVPVFTSWMEKPIDFSECSIKRGVISIPCEIEFSDKTFYDLRAYELDRKSA